MTHVCKLLMWDLQKVRLQNAIFEIRPEPTSSTEQPSTPSHSKAGYFDQSQVREDSFGELGQLAAAGPIEEVFCGADGTVDVSVNRMNPLFHELESHELHEYYPGLRKIGVRRVEHLSDVTEEDLRALGMNRFDIKTFTKTFFPLRPHFGERTSATKAAETEQKITLPSTTHHVMLSYQWDAQETVVRVRDALRGRGVPTWIDIDGGMQSDVYDSMAEGVSKSAAVVAFMNQKYQDSSNCKLELKFAASQQIPIVPVVLESGWRASAWLGIVTAGALWVPIHDGGSFEKDIDSLFGQLEKLVPSATSPALATDAEVNGTSSLASLRAELDKLRKDLQQGQLQTDAEPGNELAAVPAEVPELPSTFRFTLDMEELKALLLSEPGAADDEVPQTMSVTSQARTPAPVIDSSPDTPGRGAATRVGAFGMGGIGVSPSH
jgi:hypothetical protein